MFKLVSMFCPPLIAVAIHMKRADKPPTWVMLLEAYLLYSLFVHFAAFLVLAVFFAQTSEIIADNALDFTAGFALKYIAMTSVLSIGAALSYCVCREKLLRVTTERLGRRPLLWPLRLLSVLLLTVALTVRWILHSFGEVSLEQIFFQLRVPQKGVSTSFVFSACLQILLPAIGFIALLALFYWKERGRPPALVVKYRGKRVLPRLHLGAGLILAAVICAVCTVSAAANLDVSGYIRDIGAESAFIEAHYADPEAVAITFPEEKRNLIYIYMESMETTYMSVEQGGRMEASLIPNLARLAEEHVSFSGNSLLQGLSEVPYTTWTIAAMTAQSFGLPFRLPSGVVGNYEAYETFLPGAIALGDILEGEGYNQALMVGSDAEFDGRRNLYEQHGGFEIFDLYTAREDGIIPEDYYVWWGFEDLYLYAYAKQELTRLAGEDAPFHFTMLTADTHHIGGYVCEKCDDLYSAQYANVISCADRQAAEFVDWIMAQDFYENTTVIIVGDHLSMDPYFFSNNGIEKSDRYIYNAFINAAANTDNVKNRVITPLDMLPTTLAAIGAEIEGGRLGLGVDLFFDTPTLAEAYGLDVLDAELRKYSSFYVNQFY